MRSLVPLTLGVALAAGAAHADPDPDARARGAKLFDEGRELARAGDFTAACDRFDKSYALDPAAGTEMNLADCTEHLGQLRKAWHLFSAAATELDRTTDARAPYAHQRADALLAKLTTVVVRIAAPLPAGLALTINRHVEPAIAEVRDVVEPGAIEIVATAPDKAAITRTASGQAGATIAVDLAFVAEVVVRQPPPIVLPPPRAAHRRRSWIWGAAGVAAAGVVAESTGAVLGLLARGDHAKVISEGSCTSTGAGFACTPAGAAAEDHAVRLADDATVLTIVGGALLVAGAVFFLEAPRDAEQLRVAPMADAHTVGLTLGRAF